MHAIPTGYALYSQHDDLRVALYRNGMALIAFAGKSIKSKWHYRFPSEAKLVEYSDQWIDRLRTEAEDKAAATARRKAPSPLNAGDILNSSWGFEQTNQDYYEVTQRFGKYGVILQQVGSIRTEIRDGGWSGKCVPDPDSKIGKPFKARSDGEGWVKLTSFSGCKPEDFTEVEGIRKYRERHWSSYA